MGPPCLCVCVFFSYVFFSVNSLLFHFFFFDRTKIHSPIMVFWSPCYVYLCFNRGATFFKMNDGLRSARLVLKQKSLLVIRINSVLHLFTAFNTYRSSFGCVYVLFDSFFFLHLFHCCWLCSVAVVVVVVVAVKFVNTFNVFSLRCCRAHMHIWRRKLTKLFAISGTSHHTDIGSFDRFKQSMCCVFAACFSLYFLPKVNFVQNWRTFFFCCFCKQFQW